ncbi:MAG: hypothetical protein ACRD0D_10100 [Acidimicrobiales bacterium]
MTDSFVGELQQWFASRLPTAWFAAAPEVSYDSDEILVVGTLPEGVAARAFREETRAARIGIAQEAEHRYGRQVSWGVVAGGARTLFTSQASPVMTRLRLDERRVLDTLVEAGVARSRSEALAWCVRLVGRHEADWLRDLHEALTAVRKVRVEGPAAL